jgi:NAD(P)-dependent dehydrogenase (short-subunit alcohol dehydrogenase family)
MHSDGIVIVSGAASGMGESVCRRLKEEGGHPIGIDRAGGEHVDLELDLTDGAALEAAVPAAIEAAGAPLKGLVNAAGLGYVEPFEEADDESWQRVLDVNLMGTVRLCRLVLPFFADRDDDRTIVNFGSQAGKTGGLVVAAQYSASKAAVMCLTKTLAAVYGPQGIRVNAVSPGIHDTAFLDAMPEMRGAADKIPLRRLGTAEEVADVVLFLLSPAARYVTGEIVDVNGGLLMD